MQHSCGCKDSNCEFDPDGMTTPNMIPMHTSDSIQGHAVLSVKHADLVFFLYQHYYAVNFIVNTIIEDVDKALMTGSVCDN